MLFKNRRHRVLWTLLWILSLGFESEAFADFLVLKSGRKIRGTVLKDNPETVVFQTRSGKSYTVRRSRITEVVTEERQVQAEEPEEPPAEEAQEEPAEPAKPAARVHRQSTSKLRFGPVLGFTMANASFERAGASIDTSNRTGVMLGVLADYRFTEIFLLEAGIIFTQYGFKFLGAGTPPPEIIVKYNVLDVPLLMKARFEAGSGFYPFVVLGPSIAIKLKAEFENPVTGTTTDIGPITESLMFSIVAGAGAEYALNPDIALFLSLRYLFGITNVDNDQTTSDTIRNRVFQLFLGAAFSL